MPQVREIAAKLAALRQEVADAKRSGSTPSQLRKLLAECCALWSEMERCKNDHALTLTAPGTSSLSVAPSTRSHELRQPDSPRKTGSGDRVTVHAFSSGKPSPDG